MYQTIHETIQVAGVYTAGHFLPKKFQWRQQAFVIDQITQQHDFKDGTVLKRRFSVMANHNLYLLEFNRTQESWLLEQVWVEA